MESNKLSVRLRGKPVGLLEQNFKGQMQFTYKKDAIEPISLGLPLHEGVFDHKRCEAYFGGLVPEDDRIRSHLGKLIGVLPNNTFGFLRELGFDCMGAISFHQLQDPVLDENDYILEGRTVSPQELEKHLKQLPTRHFFYGIEGVRLLLSGMQTKSAVCLINNEIHFPLPNRFTTHIIKPGLCNKDLIYNEYFCMKIAQQLGFEIPDIQLRQVGRLWVLLIKRYDREISGHHVKRFHQEDFCQALNILSSDKFEYSGNINLKESFHLLNKTRIPAIERNRLIKILIFNYLIGNIKNHGKNYSLIYPYPRLIRLAPFYDLQSSVCAHESSKLSLKIGKTYEITAISEKDWRLLCQEIGYSYPALKRTMLTFIESSISAASQIKMEMYIHGHEAPIIDEIYTFIEQQGERAYRMIMKQG